MDAAVRAAGRRLNLAIAIVEAAARASRIAVSWSGRSIVGGAIIPLIMGRISDAPHSIQLAYSAPLGPEADAGNARVQARERLMWTCQQAIPGGPPGAKWRLMERVFEFPGARR